MRPVSSGRARPLANIHSAHKQWESLSEYGELITPQAKNREEFIKECKGGKLDGVVAAYRTFGSISITGFFDEELCNALPKSWKWLGHCGKWELHKGSIELLDP